MPSQGNMTFTCKKCGEKFIGWASAARLYCSRECAKVAIGKQHGESYSRLHRVWVDMRRRCRVETDPGYPYYGGRGISVCKEWDESYVAFSTWAKANGYADNLEIDRRDTNGNYEPGNCRWATRVQQMRNTRKRKNARTSKFKGVSKHSQNSRWVAQAHANRKTYNLGCFRTELEAALAYDDYVFARDPEHSFLNFPERKRKEVPIARTQQA